MVWGSACRDPEETRERSPQQTIKKGQALGRHRLGYHRITESCKEVENKLVSRFPKNDDTRINFSNVCFKVEQKS